MTNNEQLKQIMSEHRYGQKHIADMLLVSKTTVGRWCMSPDKPTYENMKDIYIHTLKLAILNEQLQERIKQLELLVDNAGYVLKTLSKKTT